MLLQENPSRGVCEYLMRATADVLVGNETSLQLYPGVGEAGPSGLGLITHETHIGGCQVCLRTGFGGEVLSLPVYLVDRKEGHTVQSLLLQGNVSKECRAWSVAELKGSQYRVQRTK